MNVYRCPPPVLPSLRNHVAEALDRAEEVSDGDRTKIAIMVAIIRGAPERIRLEFPALAENVDEAVREDEARREAARAPCPVLLPPPRDLPALPAWWCRYQPPRLPLPGTGLGVAA